MRSPMPLWGKLVMSLMFFSACAHQPLSASALDETRVVALIARIEDEAGPKSKVFADDNSYRDRLKRLDDKEGDRRLGNALALGSFEKGELTHHSISRFEVADSLRSNTLALLPRQTPWTAVIHPVKVARVLESFLVQQVPANAPDYQLLGALGADTVVELVVEEYGMRSEKGVAGVYLKGFARMFRIGGGQLYHRRFSVDDVSAGAPHLDPFAVRKNTELFAARVKALLSVISTQIASDLSPAERKEAKAVAGEAPPSSREIPVESIPQVDDPL